MNCQIVGPLHNIRKNMRWIATLALSLVLTGAAFAAGSDEQYLDIYNEILQADTLQQSGQANAAALRYLQAQADLQKLQTEHPTWNPDIVKFRLDYLSDRLQALAKYLPQTNAPAAAASATAQPAATGQPAGSDQTTIASLQQQNAGYQEQIRSLTAVNTELEGKLKEALSVQPAAASPEELAKAEAKITELQKEKDLLATALEQEKAANSNAIADAVSEEDKKSQAELAVAKEAAAAAESKLEAANKELESMKAAREADAANQKQAQDEMDRLKEAAGESDKILAAATRELELLKELHPGGTPPAAEGAKQGPEAADQLKQAMAEISTDETEIAHLKDAVDQAEKKWEAANNELTALKAATPAQAPATPPAEAPATAPATAPAEAPVSDTTKALIEERDRLKDELAARSKDLADAEAHHSEEFLSVRAALQQAEQQRDELEKKLAAATATPSATAAPAEAAPAQNSSTSSAVADKLEQFQARIAVLEANPVPYTAEELAILKLPASHQTPEPLKAAPAPRHPHSINDLPPGSGALWKEALDATMNHEYDTAEQKFNQVLQQDPNNVYVLAYLANAQFAAGHLEDCERTVQKALAVEPDDAGSLYLLGVLRYRQNRLEDALDALSLSAKYNPTNSATQNFLGCVLADKGLRPAAETALRKALQADPDYAEAHFNLAVVYLGNQPASLELARWHYKRALELGHPKNDMLEKLLAEKQ
jgi:Tfp pilus assembly protein PilF